MIAATAVRTWELDRTPDLVDLVSAARDAGHEVLLMERPMPDAVSVARRFRAAVSNGTGAPFVPVKTFPPASRSKSCPNVNVPPKFERLRLFGCTASARKPVLNVWFLWV